MIHQRTDSSPAELKLRDHPLMSRNWPPALVPSNRNGLDDVQRIEIGTLQHVLTHDRLPTKIFLVAKRDDRNYVASLTVNHPVFHRHLVYLLDFYIGRPLKEIGDLDMSHTLCTPLDFWPVSLRNTPVNGPVAFPDFVPA